MAVLKALAQPNELCPERYELLPDGIEYIAESNPGAWRHRASGRPNVAAICRAANLNNAAVGRLLNRQRQWAGWHTVRSLSRIAAATRGISPEQAQKHIFRTVELDTPDCQEAA